MTVNQQIIVLPIDNADYSKSIPVFLFLIPYQNFINFRISLKQDLVSFPKKEIDFCLRVVFIQFFNQRGRQNDITNESSLYDQDPGESVTHASFWSKIEKSSRFGQELSNIL